MKIVFKHLALVGMCAGIVASGTLSGKLLHANSNSTLERVETKRKVVALSFDADMTPSMLKRLSTHKVRSWYNKGVIDELTLEKVPATLFLTGMWIETYHTVTTQLAANQLFEIGNHSYSHPAFSVPCYSLSGMPEMSDADQIDKTDKLLAQYVPNYVKLFRFPGLCSDEDDRRAVAQAGYTVIGGDVLGGDGFQQNSDAIVQNVVGSVRPGSIVVLHLMGGPNAPKTAEALPKIIEQLRKKGYVFVTVSELLKLRTKNKFIDLPSTYLRIGRQL